jgi:hypothetical protein
MRLRVLYMSVSGRLESNEHAKSPANHLDIFLQLCMISAQYSENLGL